MPRIPEGKLHFKIGEVSRLTGVKPHVLRYWESELSALRPEKTPSGQRRYRRADVEMVLVIKRLLYDEGYTIAGANETLNKRSKNPHGAAAVAQLVETLQQARAAVIELIELVDERKAPRKAPGTAH
ncbi:MAG: MerR family transcriptional regulator [Myxococcales bacterium]|nr:MerR family transcriptional regulator [Myxococcales bacterium]